MARRGGVKKRGKKPFSATRLVEQEEKLKRIYRPENVSVFDTTDSTVSETARNIAQTILLKPYSEFQFMKRLNEVLKGMGRL